MDRLDGDTMALTQAQISNLLGARRETVTKTARRLQKDGLIENGGGSITLLDRPEMEVVSIPSRAQGVQDLRDGHTPGEVVKQAWRRSLNLVGDSQQVQSAREPLRGFAGGEIEVRTVEANPIDVS